MVKEENEERTAIQAERESHNVETERSDNQTRKVEKVNKQFAKAKRSKETKNADEAKFPAETSINAYAFLRVPAKVMTALGIKSHTQTNKAGQQVEVYAITKATITGYDAQTQVLSVKLGA